MESLLLVLAMMIGHKRINIVTDFSILHLLEGSTVMGDLTVGLTTIPDIRENITFFESIL